MLYPQIYARLHARSVSLCPSCAQTAMATRDATSSEVHKLDIAPVALARAVEMREEDRIRAHREIQRAAVADLRVVADNARRREREELDLGRNEELIQHRGDTYKWVLTRTRAAVWFVSPVSRS